MSPLPKDLRPDPIIELYKKDVDMAAIRENLKLTYTERALKLMERQRVAEELHKTDRDIPDRAR